MPIQAVPALVGAAPVASTSSYPSILPGPFILLLALPAIPLLLSSVGARPPDSSALPFSTDDVWQTTAFVTVAGAVVLCIGIYPEAFTDVGNWIADGASGDTWRNRWSSLTSNGPSWTHKEVIQTSNGQIQSQVGGMRMPMGVAERQPPSIKIIPPPRAPPLIRKSVVKVRPPQMVQDKHGNKWMKPGAKRRVSQLIPNPAAVLQNEAAAASANDLSNRYFPSIAAKRLAYMREGVLAPWYSPDRASLFGAAIACILVIGFFIVVTGKVLGDAYDADKKNKSSSGSSRGSGGGKEEAWYLRELRKRKGEKESETITRVDKDNKEWQAKLEKMKDEDKKKTVERRKKEIEVLKKELEKREMPLVALEIGGASGSGKSKKIKGDSKPSGNVVKADTGGKVKTSSKLKRFFLGPLADGPPKDKSLTHPATMTLPAEGGPGWKPADDAIAHAAIRGGASRAENMANDLVKQKNA